MPPCITASVARVAGRDNLNTFGCSTLSQNDRPNRVKLDQTNHDDRTSYIIESEPFINTFISVLKENSGFNCAVFTGGIMETVLILSSFLTKVKVHCHMKFDETVIRNSMIC
uniref:Uncharacterized protein n=1 Tax=Xiphophorus maculatus TaxID=8083 RepID=A0A3B5PRP3_XIPMA